MFAEKKVGLALSGGGARGIAHLGVIKALEEAGITIDRISGSSSGAIIAAFYASRRSPDEILEIVSNLSLVKYLRPALRKIGLFDMGAYRNLFSEYFNDSSFQDLKIPLTIAATNINKGETAYFCSGDLISSLMASSCVPPLFSPILINGELYVDGGILNNLPIEPLSDHCDLIIGSHCNPIDETFMFANMKTLAERSLLLAISQNAYQRREFCNIFLEPPSLKKFVTSDIGKAKELFEIGYDYTRKFLEDIKIN